MGVNLSDLENAIECLFPHPENITDESIRRACVNRKYYYIYHLLLDFINEYLPEYDLSDKGSFPNTGSHRRIYLVFEDVFKKTNNKKLEKLYLKYADFLSKRCDADYHLGLNFHEFDFKQALKYSKDIPHLIEQLRKEI